MAGLTGLHLNGEQRKIIIRGLMKGESAREINARLAKRGYEEVSDQTIHSYRRSKEITEAVKLVQEEVSELSYVNYWHRLESLREIAAELYRRMFGVVIDLDGEDVAVVGSRPANWLEFVSVSNAYRQTLRDIEFHQERWRKERELQAQEELARKAQSLLSGEGEGERGVSKAILIDLLAEILEQRYQQYEASQTIEVERALPSAE